MLCCVYLWVVVSDTCCVVFVCEWWSLTRVVLFVCEGVWNMLCCVCLWVVDNTCQRPPLTNKHNTTCVRHHHSQINTTQHVSDTTTHKQTQHNMCQTPPLTNKHNTTCFRHLHKQTTQHVSHTTTHKRRCLTHVVLCLFVSGGVWHVLCCVCFGMWVTGAVFGVFCWTCLRRVFINFFWSIGGQNWRKTNSVMECSNIICLICLQNGNCL
jgi:cation transport ATPase